MRFEIGPDPRLTLGSVWIRSYTGPKNDVVLGRVILSYTQVSRQEAWMVRYNFDVLAYEETMMIPIRNDYVDNVYITPHRDEWEALEKQDLPLYLSSPWIVTPKMENFLRMYV